MIFEVVTAITTCVHTAAKPETSTKIDTLCTPNRRPFWTGLSSSPPEFEPDAAQSVSESLPLQIYHDSLSV
jgi:hypothetical protein